jgi:hypothetical protein
MKAFFLIFLLLYLSLFPPASSVSVVEIVEEELVAHQHEVVPVIVHMPTLAFFSGFPEILSMSPQSIPLPEHRPPDSITS